MKKRWLVTVILLSSFLFSGCSLIGEKAIETSSQQNSPSPSSHSSISPSSAPIDFTARFDIYTNGTRRIFTEAKYHRQSEDVYLENPDPNLIHIKKSDLTWNDFFSTLPFSLNKECLVTGTKQTFCSTETTKLYFYLNDQEDPDALDRVIAPNDFLRVEYR